MTEEQVAEYLGIPRRTLGQWRYKGTGPRYRRVGRYIRYVPSDLISWLQEQEGRDAHAG